MNRDQWLRLLLVTAWLFTWLITMTGAPVHAQQASAINCKDFVDQAEAQRFFLAEGGPTYDAYHLDGDGDGIACEPGPAPTPVSPDHAEYCDGFLAYLVDSEADGTTGDRYRQECADYIEQEHGYPRCPSYQGLSYLYFSGLNRFQVWTLSDMQKSEYEHVMNMKVGECVAVDVAKAGAWQCRPFAFYELEYQRAMFIPISNYYRDQLDDRYQVVCLGKSSSMFAQDFSEWQLAGAAFVGALGGVFVYKKIRKRPEQ